MEKILNSFGEKTDDQWINIISISSGICGLLIFCVSVSEAFKIHGIDEIVPQNTTAFFISTMLCILSLVSVIHLFIHTLANDDHLNIKKHVKAFTAVAGGLLFLQLVFSVWAFCAQDYVSDEEYQQSLDNMIKVFGKKEEFWVAFHRVERKYKCCAYTGYEYYKNNTTCGVIPGSCCNQELYDFCTEDKAYPGCASILKAIPFNSLKIMSLFGFSLTIIEMMNLGVLVFEVLIIPLDLPQI